jgi:hypothetical protein
VFSFISPKQHVGDIHAPEVIYEFRLCQENL